MKHGVILPLSLETEWLIRWWWMSYTLQNVLPLTFFVHGTLPPNVLEWCHKHGTVIGKQEDIPPTSLWIEPWCQVVKDLKPLFKAKKEPLTDPDLDIMLFQNTKPYRLLTDTITPCERPITPATILLNWGTQLPLLQKEIRILKENLYRV